MKMANETTFGQLTEYLKLLVDARSAGHFVSTEITEAIALLRCEFGLEDVTRNVPELAWKYLHGHIKHHPLLEWSDARSTPVVSHTAKDYGNYGTADVSVNDILHQLATGKTVHQLCGEYNMDINQVTGAVTFAAYVVSNGKY